MNPYPSTATLYNTFEGGTNGSAVTVANSGGSSGLAFDHVQTSGTSSLLYTNTAPLNDGTSLAVSGDGSGYANVRWLSGKVGTLYVSCGAVHVAFSSFAAISTFLIAYGDDTDGTPNFRLKTTTSGALRLSNGANTATVADTGATMTAGQVYRIEWQINHVTGEYVIEFFAPQGTTALGRSTGTGAGLGTQTQQIRLGVVTLSTWSAKFDNFAIGSEKIGPASPPPGSGTNPYANAIAFNTAEGGTANTAVIVANSGNQSGTAFTGTQQTGTAAVTFTDTAIHDTLSYRFVGDGSGYANVRWHSSILGSLNNSCGAVYARFDSFAATITFFIALSDDADTFAYRLKTTTSGALQLANSANATVATTAATMTTGQTYRIEWQINHSTGAYAIQFYSGDSVSAAGSATGTSAGAFGAQTQQVRLGVLTLSSWSATFDSFAVHSAKIGARSSVAQPPTIEAGNNRTVDSFDLVTLSATASDPNAGDTVTVTWQQTAGNPSVTLQTSGATATFTAPVVRNGSTLTFQATASDGALQSTDSLNVTVAPHNEWAVVNGDEVPIRALPVSS